MTMTTKQKALRKSFLLSRVLTPCLVAGAFVGLTAVAHAEQGDPARWDPSGAAAASAAVPATPYLLSLDTQTIWHRGRGYQLVSRDNSHPSAGLSLARDHFGWGDRRQVALGVGWRNESLHGTWAEQNLADLGVDTFYAMAVARWAVRPWLAPLVRVSAGAAKGRMRLHFGDQKASTIEAADWSRVATLGTGFQMSSRTVAAPSSLHLPPVAFVFGMEGGYVVATAFRFSAAQAPQAADAPKDRIPVAAVNLGTLQQSHSYVTVSFGLQF